MDPDFELEFEMVGVLRAYKTTWDDGDSAAAAAATDVDLLKRAWLNEKAASDILNFDSPLASGSDRGSLSWCRVTQEEALDDFVDDGVDDLVVSLYQMDLDRTLFLLRSYLLLEKVRMVVTNGMTKSLASSSRVDDVELRRIRDISPGACRCMDEIINGLFLLEGDKKESSS
uniref:Uncharacterized protein n=1 Tax=Zea mays TaxID=4577 RepID=A0A804RCS9_MAIZE